MIICVYVLFDSDLVNHEMNEWLYRMLVKIVPLFLLINY